MELHEDMPALRAELRQRNREARWHPWLLLFIAAGSLFAGVWLGSVLEMERTYTNCSKYGEHFLSSRVFKKTIELECLPKYDRPKIAPSRKNKKMKTG